MTHQAILTEAIGRAIKGGWKDPFGIVQFKLAHGVDDDQWAIAHTAICIRQYSRNTKKMEDVYYQFELFIYRHDFAKALWADALTFGEPEWKYRLMMLVVAEDPIDYLGDYLDSHRVDTGNRG